MPYQNPRHFLQVDDLSAREIHTLITHAIRIKARLRLGQTTPKPLQDKMMTMIFDKPSTRTRLSFQSGMHQLGGQSMVINSQDSQLGRGEPMRDAARVMSRLCDMVMIRTFSHKNVEEFAQFATIPVINGLTDEHHPCQALADLMTWYEYHGDFKGGVAAWLGDATNVCRSWAQAAIKLNFQLRIASPTKYGLPPEEVAAWNKISPNIIVCNTPEEAVQGANVVMTDVWVSMGFEKTRASSITTIFEPYQVDDEMMSLADKDAIFMHCLPAHRGEEVTESVLESKQSVVWDEAENRLHIQKSLMEYLLCGQLAE